MDWRVIVSEVSDFGERKAMSAYFGLSISLFLIKMLFHKCFSVFQRNNISYHMEQWNTCRNRSVCVFPSYMMDSALPPRSLRTSTNFLLESLKDAYEAVSKKYILIAESFCSINWDYQLSKAIWSTHNVVFWGKWIMSIVWARSHGSKRIYITTLHNLSHNVTSLQSPSTTLKPRYVRNPFKQVKLCIFGYVEKVVHIPC